MLFIVAPTTDQAISFRSTLTAYNLREIPCCAVENVNIRGIKSFTMFVVNEAYMTGKQLCAIELAKQLGGFHSVFIYVDLP